MWMETHPTSHQNPTTRCNSCMVRLQEQQRQEAEIRKSNMAQVVILSARHDGHRDDLGTESKRAHSAESSQPQVKKIYAYNCPTCNALLQSSVYTGKVNMQHKSPDGKVCLRQFRVSCGQVGAAYSYCFDHAKCSKHSEDSYGVSRNHLPEIVDCKKCGKRFRVPNDAMRWKSTCPNGCRKKQAVQD